MMKLTALFIALLSTADAFSPISQTAATRTPTTRLRESFGLDFAEDTYANQPDMLKGEQEYKQFVNKFSENNMLNRKYNVVGRVRELNLLKATADAGILTKLEEKGVDLETIEELLPVIEDLGLLRLVGSNQQLLVNLVAPLLIEPAPFLIPAVAGAIETGPAAFFGLAAALAGFDFFLLANDVELPFVGLSAGVTLGLLLIPLAAVSAAAGVALASVKK